MRYNEIYSKLAPNAPNREVGFKITGNTPSVVWEDILLAMQGIPHGRFSFMMYAYANDDHARHSFFAELFMDIMADPVTHHWKALRRSRVPYDREIERMCELAVVEWGGGNRDASQQARAEFMGVSRGTWRRAYKDIYNMIVSRPIEWERAIMQIVDDRLK